MQPVYASCIAAAALLALTLVPLLIRIELLKPEGEKAVLLRILFAGISLRKRRYTTLPQRKKHRGDYGWLFAAARPRKLDISIAAGLENAASAALLCGALGMGADALAARFRKKDVSIAPLFGRNAFSARISCIIGFTIADIISAAINNRRRKKWNR